MLQLFANIANKLQRFKQVISLLIILSVICVVSLVITLDNQHFTQVLLPSVLFLLWLLLLKLIIASFYNNQLITKLNQSNVSLSFFQKIKRFGFNLLAVIFTLSTIGVFVLTIRSLNLALG